MNEEYSALEKKVWQQIEMLQEWIYSEVKLSSRYDLLNKAYRFKLNNNIQKDLVNDYRLPVSQVAAKGQRLR